MKALDIGRENVDIEYKGEIFRLSGDFTSDGCFVACNISLIGSEDIPISEEEKKEFRNSIKSAPEEFFSWIDNPKTIITSKLITISEQKKSEIMNAVRKKWNDDRLKIYFDG